MIQPLSAWDLLAVWEQAYAIPVAQQALLFLSAAWPDTPAAELAALSIGRRDSYLLALREQLFGPEFQGITNCPACEEQLEVAFQAADIRVDDTGHQQVGELFASVAGYQVRFRLPTTFDLLALEPGVATGEAQEELLRRCLLEVQHNEEAQTAGPLPAEVVNAIEARMAEADPQADVQIHLVCPTCAHEWQAIFDVVSFLRQEVNAWAIRTLRDVHALAMAYGWREHDILTMSAWRRQLYLQMVDG